MILNINPVGSVDDAVGSDDDLWGGVQLIQDSITCMYIYVLECIMEVTGVFIWNFTAFRIRIINYIKFHLYPMVPPLPFSKYQLISRRKYLLKFQIKLAIRYIEVLNSQFCISLILWISWLCWQIKYYNTYIYIILNNTFNLC